MSKTALSQNQKNIPDENFPPNDLCGRLKKKQAQLYFILFGDCFY
jgi:hypothetical protein